MARSSIIQLDESSLTLGEQEIAVYARLKEVFHDAVLFGGCLREQYIRQNTSYNAPTKDIDARVRNPRKAIPKELEAYINSLPLNTWTNMSAQPAAMFTDWIGIDITAVRNRTDRWSLEVARNDCGGELPIDLTLLKSYDPHQRLDHHILNNLRVPFSSVTYSDEGLSSHRDFPIDTRLMNFSISRKDGLRPVLWDAFYYERLKQKYPELQLANPEVPLLMLAHKLKSFFEQRGEGKGKSASPQEAHLTP